MNDPIKQAIYDELNIILKQPGQKNEQRLEQLKVTESKKIVHNKKKTCRKKIIF